MSYKENYNIQTSTKNSDLRDKLEKLLYTISAGQEFMQFAQKNKQKISEYLIKNNLYQRRYHDNLSQKQMLKTNVDRYVHAFKLAKQLGSMEMVYRKADFIFNLIGMSLNTRAFLGTIQMLGNQSQVQRWKKLVLTGQVFGSYGQTQLGHSSDVQNLQTQAYYNEQLQCFVLNSPKITSAKYWPGTLGMVCTHTVLQAKTFVKNKYIGLQTFVLQIRDKNLQPLQGVKVGDIGPKFGYHRVDNGYLIIKDLKLPLDSMLMKYIQVTPEGMVKGQQNKSAIKYAYGSMLELRVTLPFSISFGHIISPATNLYKLYQQMDLENLSEYKEEVIQYLSVGLGLMLANTSSQRLFYSFNQFMKEKNYSQADVTLAKCHIISSTFKALISWKAVQISKRVCTRNNFAMFRSTGIPYAYNYVISAPTYEGDNNVLLQQTARYLLKQIQKTNNSKPQTNIKNSNITNILPALRYVTQSQILRISNKIQAEAKLGIGANTTWNERLQRDIIDVARLWGNVELLQGFVDSIQKIDQNLRQLFTKIGKVFTKNILKDPPQVYAYGFTIDESNPERQFSQQQYWAITHLQRPLFAIQQNHRFIARQGNWLKSKL